MATSQQFLPQDNSSLTNFKAWAKALSDQIRTFGWTNSSDTGQLNGVGGGVGGSAGWAAVPAAPGSGVYWYEIFKPGDGLTPFYLKVEYGNASTNLPTVRLTLSSSTNGAGTPTGYISTTVNCIASGSYTAGGATPYECDFSGDSGRLCMMMWRNGPGPMGFCVQRSLDSSGNATGTYATLWTMGFTGGSNAGGTQQSIHFTAGVGFHFGNVTTSGGNQTGIPCLGANFAGSLGTSAFNGAIPISFAQPCVGTWDYPCTAIGGAYKGDITEGVPFTVSNQYGQSKTYMPTKTGLGMNVTMAPTGQLAVCMEYD